VNPHIEPLRIPSLKHHRRGNVNYRRHGSREEYLSGYLPPIAIPGKLLHHPQNLVTIELFSLLILFTTGNSLSTYSPPQSRLLQGLP
jgi:hypothetical protein